MKLRCDRKNFRSLKDTGGHSEVNVTQPQFIMGTQAGVGMSHLRNVTQAAKEAVQKALSAANITQPDFVFLFSSLGYDPQKLVQVVRQDTGNCPLAGCSGQGVIVQNEADESNFAIAVMVIRSDEMRFTNRYAVGLKDQPTETGQTIASKLLMDFAEQPQALFLFTDGLTVNFDRLIAGIESEFAQHNRIVPPVLGGAAGSDIEMKVTYQYCDDQVFSDGVVATLLSGDCQVTWALNHGCTPIGQERKITHAAGNKIFEIDHQPVFEVLREYLTEEEIQAWDRTIVAFCFGLKAPNYAQDHDEFVIRYLPRKDDLEGSVTLQTEVVEGSSIWITRRDAEKIAQGIDAIAQQFNGELQDRPAKLIFQFDCYGRGKSVLGELEKQRLEQKLQQQVGASLPWIGLYTHGEIAPIKGRNSFHNYTLILTAIS
ncbi:MAG: FIST C-terminal domain-containing protein [Leptolyngbya sp. Prado105]|nr:FIST C-terminal domain-containing protein [Leptolyngbya sp. Prado105]